MRAAYKSSKLSSDRIKRLEGLGFELGGRFDSVDVHELRSSSRNNPH